MTKEVRNVLIGLAIGVCLASVASIINSIDLHMTNVQIEKLEQSINYVKK